MKFFHDFKRFLRQRLGVGKSAVVRELTAALKSAARVRGKDERSSEVLFDYPILVDLCKAYIDESDFDTAEEIIRTCFKLRDEYANFGGRREAILVQRLAAEFIKSGREDLAQKVMRKVKNFEHGIPVHQLSGIFFPEREMLGEEAAVDNAEVAQQLPESLPGKPPN